MILSVSPDFSKAWKSVILESGERNIRKPYGVYTWFTTITRKQEILQ